MNIHRVSEDTQNIWVDMAHALWPDCTKNELWQEIQRESHSEKTCYYLLRDTDGTYIAFIQLSVRSDYVEGSSTHPVAYVEGIYVKPRCRGRGIGRILIQEAEKWARSKGLTELASDAEIKNTESSKFHARVGFEKAGVNVHFIKTLTLILLFFHIASPSLPAEQFRFRYQTGDRYRILSEIQQQVYLNDTHQYSSELLNRIQVRVLEIRNGSGREEVYYQHSEETQTESGEPYQYQFGQEYSAEFWIDEFGFYDIDPGYFVPGVRDVPVFPPEDLTPGDRWTARGQEVHDFRAAFGISEPYTFSMPVNYTYVGPERRNGLALHHITIEYNILHERPVPDGYSSYPHRILGSALQQLYFDNNTGRSHSYEEEYEFILSTSDGNSLRFTGTAQARVMESAEFDRDSLKRDIEERLDNLGFEESSVQSDSRGVTISIENIQFPPDSALLLPSERTKLDKIARILSDYPDRDILVSGHTALAGSVEGRQVLSKERARSVVSYLIGIGARDRSRILYRGFGAERPIADNSFEEGRRRNRRVEITILEN